MIDIDTVSRKVIDEAKSQSKQFESMKDALIEIREQWEKFQELIYKNDCANPCTGPAVKLSALFMKFVCDLCDKDKKVMNYLKCILQEKAVKSIIEKRKKKKLKALIQSPQANTRGGAQATPLV